MKKKLSLMFLVLVLSAQAQAQNIEDAHDHAHEEHEEHEDETHSAEEHQHQEDDHNHDEASHEDEHEHNHEEPGHDDHEEGTTRISSEMAEQVGIGTALAAGQTLHQNITIYGSLAAGPEQLSHVRARFEGMIKSVNVSIGDRVEAGDLLAEVESNDSLKTYQIIAPIPGQIIQRHANTGEVTQDQILFSIANFESLWAELHLFPAHQSVVAKGQSVELIESNRSFNAVINHIVPALDQPYQLARARVDNDNLSLSPGQMVEARVETGSFDVALAVQIKAIQALGGREGVFVKEDDEYTFTPLALGQRDDLYVEVLEGLRPSDEYVVENSYLIKADIEKSEAEHVH